MTDNTKLREALRALTEIATASDDSTVKGLKQLAELRLTTLQTQPAAAGVSDAEIDRILSTPIPGGSVASHWFLPHDTDKGLANVRDVVRAMLTSARAILSLRPQAVPMTEAERAEVFRKAEARMVYDLELSWRDAVVKETEAHFGITAQGAQEGV